MEKSQAVVVKPLRADAEQNRLKILAAAAEVFAERGAEASLDDIAHRAGVGVGTVYRRFPDKESLLDDLFAEKVANIVTMAKELTATLEPWTALRTFMEQACGQQSSDRALKQIMVKSDRHLERVDQIQSQLTPIIGELVERAKAEGQLRADAEVSDIPVLMMMIGTASEYVRDAKPEAWRRYFALVIDGWRAGDGAVVEPLPVAALSTEQTQQAMRNKGL